jgi:YidC/Oxa1 family membrane protein insertase
MDKKTLVQFLAFSAFVLVAWFAASWLLYGAPGRRQAPALPAAQQQTALRPATGTLPGPEGPAPSIIEGPVPSIVEGPAPSIVEGPVPSIVEGPAPIIVEAPAQEAAPKEPQPEPVEATLENEHIRTVWTSRGAALKQLDILDEHYRAPYKEGGVRPALTLVRDFQEGLCSDAVESLTITSQSAAGAVRQTKVALADTFYELVERTDERLVFQAVARDGEGHDVEVTKAVSIRPGTYDYEVELRLRSLCADALDVTAAVRGAMGIEREALQTRYLGTRVGLRQGRSDYKIVKEAPGTLVKKGPQVNESDNIAWGAVVNHYFAAVMLPKDGQWVRTVLSRSVTETDLSRARGRWPVGSLPKESERFVLAQMNAGVVISTVSRRLEPEAEVALAYRLIAAPKEDRILEGYDAGLQGLVEFGWLPGVSRLTLSILNAIHAVLPNYGLAILVLTGFVRLVLHPLTRKSQLSMTKMQKLQPQIVELQRKYADDKQKLTQEQMKLWQKYGVHPLSGCWPIFVQMPVLIALYGALSAAIQLRHAGFLWVDDLSRPDTLFYFPFYLPVVQNQFNLLPLIVIGVMFLNQRFTPQPPTDQARQQQQMMKFMPVLMGLFFYGLPSGLCLYFAASMGVGVLESWIIRKKADRMELTPVDEAPRKERRTPAAPPPPQSRWQRKLGELQRKLHGEDRPRKRPRP